MNRRGPCRGCGCPVHCDRRGNCLTCYGRLQQAVRRGKTTWPELEAQGKALPLRVSQQRPLPEKVRR